MDETRTKANDDLYARLKAQYEIVIDEPPMTAASSSGASR